MEAEVSDGKRGRWLGWATIALVGIGAAVTLYVIAASSIKPDDGRPKPATQNELAGFARGGLAKLETPPVPRLAPATAFTGPDGRPTTLAAYRGKVTVVNLWATWCTPCVTEMPTLARLQRAAPEVSVVAVSIDGPKDVEKARGFMAGNAPLAFHHSPEAALAWALEAKGFPTTVIYDRAGRERARLSGPAEWDGPEVRALLARLEAEPG